jgi:sugar O-acyltransferase (sialic acid O-acetyltransferase NeuD family)
MKKVVLVGNATTAEILHSYLVQDCRYKVIASVVDDEFIDHGGIDNVKTYPMSQIQDAISPGECVMIMAMGYANLNRGREEAFRRVKGLGYNVEAYIHPDAHVFTAYPIGEGSVIFPGALIEPNVRIGRNSLIWGNVTLAHHCVVADSCWVAAGAVVSGKAVIEKNTFVGVNATIVNGVKVSRFCVVGAGALISKNLKPSSVVLSRSGELLRYSADEYVKYFGF